MGRAKRADQFRHDEVGIAHCIQRCVRRAYLAGDDAVTGKSFEYRREWIRRRLELLAAVFGVDVLSYAVLSNHLHLILRTRPDVVKLWSDEEIATRWLRLFPGRRLESYLGEPTKQDIAQLVGNAKRLIELRKRLSDISWFMRALCEPIARQANREDQCTGRFWEGRFKAQKIVDEAGLLACSMYVDLNPVRAALALSPEKSRFTSAYDRIASERGALSAAAAWEHQPVLDGANATRRHEVKALRPDSLKDHEPLKKQSKSDRQGKTKANTKVRVDAWMAPLELDERSHVGASPSQSGLRASDKGFLSMRLSEYLTLLDWTGREGKDGKRGAIPSKLEPILERIGIDGTMWCDLVWSYSKYFGKSQATGRSENMQAEATRQGRAYLRGQATSRSFFV